MSTSTVDPNAASRGRVKVSVKLAGKLAVRGVLLVVLLTITVYLVRAFDARRMPDLRLWHRASLDSEFRASDYRPDLTFGDYQRIEEKLFEELEQEVYQKIQPTSELALSRYALDGLNNPLLFPRNWNRSYELVPPEIKGGVLLLHGLTDSPYSLQKVGKIFESQGFYVLGIRLPGHGTVPAALTSVTRADWMAATRLGARHVHGQIGGRGPFYMVGYSAGGGLAVEYALEALTDSDLPGPDRLILFSPAIGVTRFASLANWHKALSWMTYFEKFKWQDIQPEYDPFKYNSFPKNGGDQMHLVTKSVQRRVNQIKRANRISELPPILTFQSLVDTTILTNAIVERLYDKLEGKEHELVLFDVNRVARVKALLLASEHRRLLHELEHRSDLPYLLTVITNAGKDSPAVVERTKLPHSNEIVSTDLGLSWPAQVYSLSHVAIPFSLDDWIYGHEPTERMEHGIALGAMHPRGERDLLRVSIAQLMRLRHNPFFEYIERRLVDDLGSRSRESGVRDQGAHVMS